MNKTTKSLAASGAALTLAAPMSSALGALEDSVSFGAWFNYEYVNDNKADENVGGDIDYPSFNIYVNHHPDDTPWFLDAELRIGEGSFQSFSGDDREWGFKELAVGRSYGEAWTMRLGKTEVPFTYSRFNFWPGERMARGFGDQYNPGLRLDYDPSGSAFDMSLMFIKSQNWGDDTTSQDDGAKIGYDVNSLGQHWGSNETYRKVNTLVGDFGITTGDFRHGLSVQAGQLATQEGVYNDITPDDPSTIDGGDETETHWAAGLYTEGSVEALELAGQVVHFDQGDLGDLYASDTEDDKGRAPANEEFEPGEVTSFETRGEGQMAMLSAGYNAGDFFNYADLSMRFPDSDLDQDDTTDLVLGSRYDYGPGWIYAEFTLTNLTQEDTPVSFQEDAPVSQGGFYTTSGDRQETVHLTMDYYF